MSDDEYTQYLCWRMMYYRWLLQHRGSTATIDEKRRWEYEASGDSLIIPASMWTAPPLRWAEVGTRAKAELLSEAARIEEFNRTLEAEEEDNRELVVSP